MGGGDCTSNLRADEYGASGALGNVCIYQSSAASPRFKLTSFISCSIYFVHLDRNREHRTGHGFSRGFQVHGQTTPRHFSNCQDNPPYHLRHIQDCPRSVTTMSLYSQSLRSRISVHALKSKHLILFTFDILPTARPTSQHRHQIYSATNSMDSRANGQV